MQPGVAEQRAGEQRGLRIVPSKCTARLIAAVWAPHCGVMRCAVAGNGHLHLTAAQARPACWCSKQVCRETSEAAAMSDA